MLNRESQKSLNPRHPATANRRFNQLWSRYEESKMRRKNESRLNTISFAVILWLGSYGISFDHSCPAPQYSEFNAVVEVLVEFGFSDPTYNQEWIFDSLEPTLLEVESNQKKFPFGLSASYFDK